MKGNTPWGPPVRDYAPVTPLELRVAADIAKRRAVAWRRKAIQTAVLIVVVCGVVIAMLAAALVVMTGMPA